MKWKMATDLKSQISNLKSPDQIIDILLENRGLKTEKEIAGFLNPPRPDILFATVLGIDTIQLRRALSRIKKAIGNEEPVVVYGDYDADGICATAILWETLRDLGAKALPFIPLREKEGYGLSKEGIDSVIQDARYKIQDTKKGKKGMIISVDSGIAANEAIDYARGKGLDVIVVDHHEKPKKLPEAFAIIHTSELCAAGISYFLANELLNVKVNEEDSGQARMTDKWLELACIAAVTDLMPLVGANRSIVKYGLELLNKTTRPGLRALFNVAGIEKVGTYEIGFMIGPRLNASGRIENALLALRMLCTKDFSKALEYAKELNETNKQRQEMMEEQTLHALEKVNSEQSTVNSQGKIIVIEHESYHQGIIGLIAGKLVEKYYLPAIVISKGETLSKASARSISGFNIIEAIRSTSEFLVGAGGHPMAAGFTIETSQISKFKAQIYQVAQEKITTEMLEKVLRVDMELGLEKISMDLYQKVKQFEPFGMGNPEPVFASAVRVQNLRTVGQEGKHLKLVVSSQESVASNQVDFDAIAFNQGGMAAKIKVGNQIQIAYNIDLNSYNGQQSLQLKIKDIKLDDR